MKRFLRVDFVDAQRNIDDDNTSGSNKLSGAFASYYKHNLDQAENADSAISIIDENNEKLSDHYKKSFERLMKTIQGLGVPPVHDRKLKIVSSLSPQDALKGNTELFYNDPGNDHDLPEAYNGLGFKNLVFLAVQIDHYHRQWIDTKEDRPFCQVIFIEEPEVHLHVQVQQTFIKNMWDLLSKSSPEKLDPPQLAITTHSPHILEATEFSKVRYFRRCQSNAGFETQKSDGTTIHSLGDFEPQETDADINFLQKYLKLTHCDLFFADAAILIEGTVERLLLPEMIKKTAPDLNANYLTILEVGGAYASCFAGLLKFLHIPYLVITDIDSVDPENSQRACRADKAGAETSNATLKSFFMDTPSITDLNGLSVGANEQSNDNRYIAFQRSVTATIDNAEHSFHGRTLEETFVYENLQLFQNGLLSIGIEIPDDHERIYQNVYDHIRKGSFKKTKFALDLLSREVDWQTPVYISNGLEWLDKKLNPSTQNTDTTL